MVNAMPCHAVRINSFRSDVESFVDLAEFLFRKAGNWVQCPVRNFEDSEPFTPCKGPSYPDITIVSLPRKKLRIGQQSTADVRFVERLFVVYSAQREIDRTELIVDIPFVNMAGQDEGYDLHKAKATVRDVVVITVSLRFSPRLFLESLRSRISVTSR